MAKMAAGGASWSIQNICERPGLFTRIEFQAAILKQNNRNLETTAV